MKYLFIVLIFGFSFLATSSAEETVDLERAANTIILTDSGVKNLRLETIETEERPFHETVFTIGRVKDVPGRGYAVSSRIQGRAVKVNARLGDRVNQGETLVEVESRQPGDPPPVIPLKALRDGVIIEANIIEGKPVSPDEALFTIADRSLMWITAEIPEQRAAGIAEGTKAKVSFPALGGEPIEAKLLRFGIEADATAGSIHGIFEIENTTGRLSPGMRAELNIIISSRQDVMAVPEEAIQGNPSARVVYVKDFELKNAFVVAPVVLGASSGGWVEVLEGLFPGDEVVTRGSYSLAYVGAGGGPSLKEALDAAHGHEHNEDGSKMTPEQIAAKEGVHGNGHNNENNNTPKWLIYYAGGSTLLLIVFAQLWWNNKRKEDNHA